MSTSSIKKVNLEQIQRPKTLVVIRYKGKRVSIPLFESLDNITEYLWHQLVKFQKTVLQKQQKSKQHRNSYTINDILCFTAYEQEKNAIDIKMNILLSMSRLSNDYGKSKTDIKELDITSYYKYLQIQPYYGFTSKQLIPQYQLFSVLKVGSYFTVYLGRKISEGRFYSVKVCRNDSRISQNQYSSMRSIHGEQLEFDSKFQLGLIPRIEEVRKADGLFIYIYEYCPGGNLRHALRKNISEMQCLHYMKQLVWGIHTLHHKFNLIYRALCFDNISVDFVGNLRLDNFAYCQPCFANYLSQSNVAESYDQKYEIPNVQIPPEVQRSCRYNHLVDYYGIGVVLQEMFGQANNYKFSTKKQKEGIEIAIENFMAENIKDRQLFVNEIISELHEEKIKAYSGSTSKRSQTMEHQRLAFHKIFTGQCINVEQKTNNGIIHQEVLKILKPSHDDQFYYLNPVKKSRKNSKNKSKSKSKSKSKEKPNEDKNTKPLNATGVQQRIKSKIKKNGSDKSLNKSIDSRNNSAKSQKLKVSQQKIKEKQKPPRTNIGSTNIKQGIKNIIPKSPKNPGSALKSPNKNAFNQTIGYQNAALSPPKLFSNKSKNKL